RSTAKSPPSTRSCATAACRPSRRPRRRSEGTALTPPSLTLGTPLPSHGRGGRDASIVGCCRRRGGVASRRRIHSAPALTDTVPVIRRRARNQDPLLERIGGGPQKEY